MLQHQRPWMNPGAALGRAIGFFALWVVLSWALDRMSRRQDADPDPRLPARLQAVAGPGLVLYALSVTFFSFDWLMSLNTSWFSSIFGFYMMGSQALAAFAFVIVVIWLLASAGTLPDVYQPRHLHDIGKLLLAFVMVWAYFSVSQFLIIWSGNLPEEISWYYVRMGPAWKGLSLAVVLLHFALPFGLLLSADIKRDVRRLGPVALLLLAMRWVEVFWQAAPGLSPGKFAFHFLDLAAFAGLGGVWTWLFFLQLARRPLVPLGDEYLPEALSHHG
jgi:hypothetical protein